MQDARPADQRAWHLVRREDERRLPVPQHGALAVAGVDQDHRQLVPLAATHRRVPDVDALVRERRTRRGARLVVAEGSDICAASAPARERHQRRGDLAPGLDGERLQALLAVGGWESLDHAEVVDGVLPDADDVDLPACRHGNRDAHRC